MLIRLALGTADRNLRLDFITAWLNVTVTVSQCHIAVHRRHLRPCLVRKIFQDSPSHRILRHMHGALNIYENKNYLHSSSVNREINLLSLVTL